MFTETFTGRQGRNKYCLYVPQIFSSVGKNSFYYCGVAIWNNLPPDLCSIDRVSNFKTSFKRLFCS